MSEPITSKDELYERVLKLNGQEAQAIVAIEELSELQKELTKYLRGKANIEHIAEEMADCEIMLEQLKKYFNLSKEVEEEKEKKIARLTVRVHQKEIRNYQEKFS